MKGCDRFPWGKILLFFILVIFVPELQLSLCSLCWQEVGDGRGTDTFESPHCKAGSLSCGCSYLCCKFPWIMVLMMLRMIPWCVENSKKLHSPFNQHSLNTTQEGSREASVCSGSAEAWHRVSLRRQPEDFRVHCRKRHDKLEKVSFYFTKCLCLYPCELPSVSPLCVKEVKRLPTAYPDNYELALCFCPFSPALLR